jgi:pyrrolidone-carboxylate peptidase
MDKEASQKKILITAFRPFGGRTVNRSQEILDKIIKEKEDGFKNDKALRDLVQRKLLVIETELLNAKITLLDYNLNPLKDIEKFKSEFRLLLNKFSPSGVIMMGEHSGISGIRIERYAMERLDTGVLRDIPGILGVLLGEFGTWKPVGTEFSQQEADRAILRQKFEPVKIKTKRNEYYFGQVSAGEGSEVRHADFWCNEFFLVAQKWANTAKHRPRILFIHVGYKDSKETIEVELRQVKRYLWEMIDEIIPPDIPWVANR